MSTLTITIDGYGAIRVKRPKAWSDDAFDEAVAWAVARTLELVVPTAPRVSFHPVLGFAPVSDTPTQETPDAAAIQYGEQCMGTSAPRSSDFSPRNASPNRGVSGAFSCPTEAVR